MDYIFKYSLFDGDISSWDVSNVTSMNSMFYRAEKFNSDIGNWYVSNVTDMSYMFSYADCFNQDIGKWAVSNVTSMFKFFICASSFNQDISNWDTSNVTDMRFMFCDAEKFADIYSMNRIGLHNNIHSLPISIPRMDSDYMNGVGLHNQILNNWDVSNVTSMKEMFCDVGKFNQELNFNTSNVTSMKKMFCHAEKFNQPLIFDTSNVVNMDYMFNDAKSFLDKYNSGEDLPYYTNEIKDWINNNRDKMNEIDIKEQHGDEIDDFFNIISNTKKIIF